MVYPTRDQTGLYLSKKTKLSKGAFSHKIYPNFSLLVCYHKLIEVNPLWFIYQASFLIYDIFKVSNKETKVYQGI